ncbi:DUF1642 domain-containing protein [Lacticaseibacillus rhamnosus]|uniref:DUF1642 domain-containing protein n=1 Tax=Lacticaseibacillus rhamnosus TaxID=47715 RepID=UPI00237F67CF|nr:DUF1642 domain-containing protein [Lacticaseibacillus rhamnosus]MDE3293500.1 DUF1642 domain-containing protein [Lacticaseibacillus rhamnosus]
MSEEKLYAVKNRSGEFWDFSDGSGFWILDISERPTTTSKEEAELVAKNHGGHVVTFVEEPEKVVLNEEQAKIIEDAHTDKYPACYISDQSDDEELLMNAYVNDYTVAKEAKYLVYKVLGGKQKHEYFAQAYRSSIYLGTVSWILTTEVTNKPNGSFAQFTEAEIEHYGLQDCEKEEVTDDDD